MSKELAINDPSDRNQIRSDRTQVVTIFYSKEYTVENGFDTIAKAGELFGLLQANPV